MSKSAPDARPERWLAALALLAVCVISLGNVVVRYTTDASFAFTEEFSVFLLVVLTFAGAALAARRHVHIRIDWWKSCCRFVCGRYSMCCSGLRACCCWAWWSGTAPC
nr:TRAP transporter small permease [Oceanisphaera psychrotolerans]